MGILSFLNKNRSWETDFKKFAETATEKKLDEFVKTLPDSGLEIDYSVCYWGHAYAHNKKINHFISHGHCFYTGLHGRGVNAGDIFLIRTASEKLGRFLVLNVEDVGNPRDMYWVYVVCVGYTEYPSTVKVNL